MYFITKICSFTLEGCLLRRSQAATRLPDCVICPSLCWFVLCGNESAASLSHTNSKSRQKKENSTKFQSLDKIKKIAKIAQPNLSVAPAVGPLKE